MGRPSKDAAPDRDTDIVCIKKMDDMLPLPPTGQNKAKIKLRFLFYFFLLPVFDVDQTAVWFDPDWDWLFRCVGSVLYSGSGDLDSVTSVHQSINQSRCASSVDSAFISCSDAQK